MPTQSTHPNKTTTPFFDAKAALLQKKFHRWSAQDQKAALDLLGDGEENLLHIAGWVGGVEQILPDLITPKLLTQTTRLGHSPAHLAAYHGHLTAFPAQALTEETLLLANPSGYQPLHLALTHTPLPQYGPRHINRHTQYQINVINHLKGQLTTKVLTQRSPKGEPTLHLAINALATPALPKALLTRALLECENELRETALSALARTNQLEALPLNTLSAKEIQQILQEIENSEKTPHPHPWKHQKDWLLKSLKKAQLQKVIQKQSHPCL